MEIPVRSRLATEQRLDSASPLARALCTLNKRDAAIREIIARHNAAVTNPAGKVLDALGVRHVVLCPQTNCVPVFAVFLRCEDGAQEAAAVGAYVLVDADGSLLPVSNAWRTDDDGKPFPPAFDSSLDCGLLRDVNGDGVIEILMTFSSGKGRDDATFLQIVSLDRKQQSLLQVGYNRCSESWIMRPLIAWDWTLVETDIPGVSDVVLGPVSSTNRVRAAAVYKWEGGRFVGPAGAQEDVFMRIDTLPPGGYRQFLRETPMAFRLPLKPLRDAASLPEHEIVHEVKDLSKVQFYRVPIKREPPPLLPGKGLGEGDFDPSSVRGGAR